jgi:aminoglycoside phosphotransferase (APT) family kinase protein
MSHGGAKAAVRIDTDLVRALLADQFPELASLPVRPVELDGHDNRTFRLGGELSVRLPTAAAYAEHVAIEHEWLPKLAPRLPLPVPVTVGRGAPGCGYPWPWSLNRWIRGCNATLDRIGNPVDFARDLAGFLLALQSLDCAQGPAAGPHSFFRGGSLSVYDAETRECIDALRDEVDTAAATEVWESALGAAWIGPDVWVHGDVAPGNLLVEGGRLCAVIDFGQLAVGDPACDTAIAWSFLRGESRRVFREALSADEGVWERGRAWALWKAMLQLRAHRNRDPRVVAEARRVIGEVLAD